MNSSAVHGLAELWYNALPVAIPLKTTFKQRETKHTWHPKVKTPNDLHVCDSCAYGAHQVASRHNSRNTSFLSPSRTSSQILVSCPQDESIRTPATTKNPSSNLTTAQPHGLGSTLKKPKTINEGKCKIQSLPNSDWPSNKLCLCLLCTKDKNPPLSIMFGSNNLATSKRTPRNRLRIDKNGGETADHEPFWQQLITLLKPCIIPNWNGRVLGNGLAGKAHLREGEVVGLTPAFSTYMT